MKRPTYKDLQADLRHTREALALHEQALQDVLGETVPDATARVRDGAQRRGNESGTIHNLRLYRATAAVGGIVVEIIRRRGQRVGVEVMRLDDMRELPPSQWVSEYVVSWNAARSEFLARREAMLEEAEGLLQIARRP